MRERPRGTHQTGDYKWDPRRTTCPPPSPMGCANCSARWGGGHDQAEAAQGAHDLIRAAEEFSAWEPERKAADHLREAVAAWDAEDPVEARKHVEAAARALPPAADR